MNKIFVYGIFTEKGIREGAFKRKVKVYPATVYDFKLGYHSGDYGHFKNASYQKGETINSIIMEVTDEELIECDRIEGVSRGLYERLTVKTDKGEVFMYSEPKKY